MHAWCVAARGENYQSAVRVLEVVVILGGSLPRLVFNAHDARVHFLCPGERSLLFARWHAPVGLSPAILKFSFVVVRAKEAFNTTPSEDFTERTLPVTSARTLAQPLSSECLWHFFINPGNISCKISTKRFDSNDIFSCTI